MIVFVKRNRKKLMAFLAAFILLLLAATIYRNTILRYRAEALESNRILRQAVTIEEIDSESYIIASHYDSMMGPDWKRIDGGKNEYCTIIGENLPNTLVSYEFSLAHNRYVFYVTEASTGYDLAVEQDVSIYYVSGWDILWPIRHEEVSILNRAVPDYLLESDIRSDRREEIIEEVFQGETTLTR